MCSYKSTSKIISLLAVFVVFGLSAVVRADFLIMPEIEQLKDLETTINNTDCDSVIIGTPIDLTRIISIKKPSTRVFYDLQEIGNPNLTDILGDFTDKHNLG